MQDGKPDLFARSQHYVAPRLHALQTTVITATRTAAIFSCQLASARLSCLRQHAVNGSALLPASALAEMAIAAVRLLGEDAGSSGSSIAVAAVAVSAAPRLAATKILSTTVVQDSSVCIATPDGGTVATAHAAVAAHLSTETSTSAAAESRKQQAAAPLARIVRASPLLADAAAPSRPLAALRLSPCAEDGFWVHPGLLSAALVLADTCEEKSQAAAQVLLALDCYAAAAAAAIPAAADMWASAADASSADIRSSGTHTASMQVRTLVPLSG